MVAKRRSRAGNRHWNVKISDARSAALAQEYNQGGITMKAMAIREGVTPGCIRRIVLGIRKQHITKEGS